MKNIFVKSAIALTALFALTGCTVSEMTYDSSNNDYSINIVDKSDVTETPAVEEVDYAGMVELVLDSSNTSVYTTVQSVKSYIDGDTTHFNVPKDVSADGILKARYIRWYNSWNGFPGLGQGG